MVTAAREGPPEALATFALRAVPWLSPLHDAALERVLSLGRLVRFRAGQTILAELESGEEMYLLLSGTARVTVQAGPRARRQVGHLGPGDPCGEVSALTQALRSATVVADGEVLALRLERAGFEELVLNHPQIAVHFARVLAQRFADTDAALESAIEAPPAVQGPTALPESHRGLGLAWRELVVARRRELPFLALVSFTAALAVVRGAAWALQLEGRELFGFLRGAYVTGIALVFASTALSLLRFRPALQRALALFFGAGLALILNELSVFLAFDIFYLDMTRRDPAMLFSVEALYRRGESVWAVALALAALSAVTFLRDFLRRSAYLVAGWIRRLGPGGRAP